MVGLLAGGLGRSRVREVSSRYLSAPLPAQARRISPLSTCSPFVRLPCSACSTTTSRGLAEDAEAKEGRDAGARAWLRELRDVPYELGDAVNDFLRAGASDHQQPLLLQPSGVGIHRTQPGLVPSAGIMNAIGLADQFLPKLES